MKKYKFLLCSVIIFALTLAACVAVYAKDSVFSVSGITEPGDTVTFMITKPGTDMTDLQSENIKKIESAEASKSDGSYYAEFTIDDAQLDSDGKITNYELHSSIPGLTIDDVVLKSGDIDAENLVLKSNQFSIDSNGIIFVPLVESLNKLGITMTEIETGIYNGFGKNGEINIVIGKDTAEVDWVDIELPAPSKYENGVAMIPAYLIEDAARTSAPVYDAFKQTLTIEYPDPDLVYEDYFNLTKKLDSLQGVAKQTIISPEDFINNAYIAGSAAPFSKELVTVDGDGFNKALRLTVDSTSDGTIPEGKALRMIIRAGQREIKTGEVAVISFKARGLSSADETRVAMATVQYERSDWQKALDQSINIELGKWQQFDLLVHSDYYDMWQGASNIYFNLGGKAQSFEIGDFSLTYYGGGIDIDLLQPEQPYKGMGEDALWRKEAYRRIDKYRKDDTTIRVTDKNGNPVKDAQIEVKQTKNDYMFGIAVVADEVLDIDESTKEGKIRKSILEDSCNTLVCGSELKSAEMINNDGVNGIQMVNKFLDLNKRIRGHTIFWDGEALLNIDGYESMPYDEAYRKVMDYVIPTAYAFKGKFAQWDVLNEIMEANFTRINHNTTRLYADVIKKVKEIDPDVKLYVNETGFEGGEGKGVNGRITGFRSLIEQLKNEGAPIDGIGIQAHCTQFYYPQGFYHDLDEFAKFANEIAITEYDFRNVRQEFADEHLRDMLLVTFSHPKTTCFTIWGYYDPLHWRNSAPFYDKDWNEKPAKAVWDKMVNVDFMTNTSVVTDAEGKGSFRGFYGDYDITVKVNGLETTCPYSIKKNQDNSITVIVGDTMLSVFTSGEPDQTPTPVEYDTWTQAKEAYYELYDRVYDGVVIEGNMDNIAQTSLVEYGDKNLDSNPDWLSGKKWGTYYGTIGMVKDTSGGTLYVDNIEAKDAANIRKHISTDIITDECNLETSFIFDTLDARCSMYTIDFSLQGDGDCPLGTLTNDKNGYHLKTVGGHTIDLLDNSSYELIITLVYGSNGYNLKYDLVKDFENVIEPISDGKSDLGNASKVDSVVIKPKGLGGKQQDVFLFRSTRLKYRVYKPIIKLSNIDYANILLDDNMKDFDVSGIGYTFVANSDKKLLSGDYWRGLDQSYANGFSYVNNGKYLWTLMPADYLGKKHTIEKCFIPAKSGENITMTAKFNIKKLASYYNSTGYSKISLESVDGSLAKDIIKLDCAGYGNSYELLLLDKNPGEGETLYWSSPWTNKNLDLTVNITQNISGDYDVTVSLYDFRTKDTFTYTKENYISASDIEKLNTFAISAQRTGGQSDPKGSKLFGIKNILLTKTCNESVGQGEKLILDNERLAVDYDNVVEWPFDASVIVGAYKDGKLIDYEIIEYSNIQKANGELWFTPKECGQDYFKVFVFNNMENLFPMKPSEKFNLIQSIE